MAASIIYTVLGNLDQPDRAIAHVTRLRKARTGADWKGVGPWLRRLVSRPIDPAHSEATRGDRHNAIALGAAWVLVVQLLVTAGDNLLADLIRRPLLRGLVRWLRARLPDHIDTILNPFVSTGTDGAPATQEFCDRGFMGLPLDNQMDDLFFVIQLFSYPGNYVEEKPTLERIAETLDKFEEDVLRAAYPGIRGERHADVRFGEPLEVPKERESKNAVSEWTDLLEQKVQGLLDEINAARDN